MPIPVLLVRCETFTAWTAENSTAWIAPKQEYNTRFNPATRVELQDVDGDKGGVINVWARARTQGSISQLQDYNGGASAAKQLAEKRSNCHPAGAFCRRDLLFP